LKELIVDNFAGGGGASTGIEMAIGRAVDIAINHDEKAIKMHKVNHPHTKHYIEDVWDVDPLEATQGQPVGLAWFSPDCKHFSKAKGGKPVDKKIRGLAWVAVKWAKAVHPRVIILENVEEFRTWGPLVKDEKGDLYPDPKKKGKTFELFIKALEKQGYKVSFRELRACDYGAPTTRKRFFMIARCDGEQIVWPEPTHGDPEGLEVRCGLLKPWRTASECIDWNIPCPSIFDRKKPLAENTLRRIARGIQKFVIDNPEPFIIPIGYGEREGQKPRVNDINEPLGTIVSSAKHYLVAPVVSQIGQTGGGDRLHDIQEPLSTIVSKAEHLLVTPFLQHYYGQQGEEIRASGMNEPVATIPTANRFGLVTAFISKYYGIETSRSVASCLDDPLNTITARQGQALCTAFISRQFKTGVGHELSQPLATSTTVNKSNLVTAFLLKYYGTDIGQTVNSPLHTITTKDRFGIVTVHGEDYQIIDIGMRMLKPHELYKAQGFPDDYIIDRDSKGNPYPIVDQVAKVGNSVCPPLAAALVRANYKEKIYENIAI
jgi:DNA (cytosine-5)-methyltransferase 1